MRLAPAGATLVWWPGAGERGVGSGSGGGLITIETPDGEVLDRERVLELARELLDEVET